MMTDPTQRLLGYYISPFPISGGVDDDYYSPAAQIATEFLPYTGFYGLVNGPRDGAPPSYRRQSDTIIWDDPHRAYYSRLERSEGGCHQAVLSIPNTDDLDDDDDAHEVMSQLAREPDNLYNVVEEDKKYHRPAATLVVNEGRREGKPFMVFIQGRAEIGIDSNHVCPITVPTDASLEDLLGINLPRIFGDWLALFDAFFGPREDAQIPMDRRHHNKAIKKFLQHGEGVVRDRDVLRLLNAFLPTTSLFTHVLRPSSLVQTAELLQSSIAREVGVGRSDVDRAFSSALALRIFAEMGSTFTYEDEEAIEEDILRFSMYRPFALVYKPKEADFRAYIDFEPSQGGMSFDTNLIEGEAEGGGKYLKRRGVSSVSSWFKSKDPLERRFAALVPLEWPDDDAEASSQDQDRAEGGGGSSSSSSLMRAIWKVRRTQRHSSSAAAAKNTVGLIVEEKKQEKAAAPAATGGGYFVRPDGDGGGYIIESRGDGANYILRSHGGGGYIIQRPGGDGGYIVTRQEGGGFLVVRDVDPGTNGYIVTSLWGDGGGYIVQGRQSSTEGYLVLTSGGDGDEGGGYIVMPLLDVGRLFQDVVGRLDAEMCTSPKGVRSPRSPSTPSVVLLPGGVWRGIGIAVGCA